MAWNGLNSNLNKFLSSFSFSHKKHHQVTRSELLNVDFSLLFIWHCSKSVWSFAYELGTALHLHIQYIIKTQNIHILWQEKVYTRKSAFVLIFKSFLHKQLHSTTKIFRESFENLECAKIIEKLAILQNTTELGVGVGAAADYRLGEVICRKSQIFKK